MNFEKFLNKKITEECVDMKQMFLFLAKVTLKVMPNLTFDYISSSYLSYDISQNRKSEIVAGINHTSSA